MDVEFAIDALPAMQARDALRIPFLRLGLGAGVDEIRIAALRALFEVVQCRSHRDANGCGVNRYGHGFLRPEVSGAVYAELTVSELG